MCKGKNVTKICQPAAASRQKMVILFVFVQQNKDALTSLVRYLQYVLVERQKLSVKSMTLQLKVRMELLVMVLVANYMQEQQCNHSLQTYNFMQSCGGAWTKVR